jgi:glycosyltransferase involved in cell wall biosynthesis
LYELIIVDDNSHEETRSFIDGLRMADNGKASKVRLTKTRNVGHCWTNHSWRIGAKLATGDYIAICNSDIVFSDHWDSYLIDTLKTSTIACPYEMKNGVLIDLDPTIKKIDPLMLKGPCFMFRTEDRDDLFKFPDDIVHWYGDRAIADIANKKMSGVSFNILAHIVHKTTSSGRLVDHDEYKRRIIADLKAYEKWSGRDESLILNSLL